MSKTLRTLGLGSAAALFATTGFAQQGAQFAQTQPTKSATYHLATGTWGTDAGANLGPKELYDNTASSGFFGLMTNPHYWYDTGRLPGTNDPNIPNAKADEYVVNGFQIGYCTSQGPNGTGIDINFYQSLASCVMPGAPTITFLTLVPGSSAPGVTACWLVTFDLEGTSFEFKLQAEGEGIFDGSDNLDSFGWSFHITSTSGGNAGPILCGDPANAPKGTGTYYNSPGLTGSGLGLQDQFWLIDTTGGLVTGCYWFGGYIPGTAPYGAFWMEMFGDNQGGATNCEKFCQTTVNSTGGEAKLSIDDCDAASEVDANGRANVAMTATSVPNQPGIFFHGANNIEVPFGNGFLCAGGGIVRGAVVFAANNTATYTMNVPGQFPGSVRYFQYWYRDPAGGGSSYNTSNSYCITFKDDQ